MNSNLLGNFISIGYVVAVLLAATLLRKFGVMQGEGSRKLIHIAVSGWWLIAMATFTSPWAAMLAPGAFILVNALSLRFRLIGAMERPEGESGIGTVYYAISLAALAGLCFGGVLPPYVGALGIFSMGLGDGFAAILGKRFAKSTYAVWGKQKSYLGSAVMFLFSFAAALAVLLLAGQSRVLGHALLVALAATMLEAASPTGLDNITVPLGAAGFYWLALGPAALPGILPGLLIGLALSGAIAFFTYKLGMLTRNGGIAACLAAAGFYALGGVQMWALLMLFFFSSSVIGKLKKKLGREAEDAVTRKQGPRDAAQVLANSLPALLCLGLHVVTSMELFLLAAIGAVAASNADTWASEIGTLSKKQPVSILTGKTVPKGLSGGVSLLGFAASAAGAAWIGLAAAAMYGLSLGGRMPLQILGAAVAIGFAGALADSLLGALLQAKYQCVVCQKFTEKPSHHDQTSRFVSGLRWMDNDMVNFISGLLAALFGMWPALWA